MIIRPVKYAPSSKKVGFQGFPTPPWRLLIIFMLPRGLGLLPNIVMAGLHFFLFKQHSDIHILNLT